ncbi:MAG TPA: hypothetical protein VFN41_02340 [Candidatus Limnocylindrales bacterium]|nr:hypothetical protein [Candidatus Limnocylindrales bacterium]
MNWHRMGRTGKALVHLAVMVIGTAAFFLIDVSRALGAVVQMAVAVYLYAAQGRDQAHLLTAGPVTARSGLAGAAIALIGSVLIVGSMAVVVAAVGDDYEHRGEVLFHPAEDDECAAAESVTAFGQAEPIFWTAVMRETVQPGSRVVVEIDGPGGTHDSRLVLVEPPFDCLVSSKPLRLDEPGSYVVRYQYAGLEDRPDLAKGTLTIRPSPAGSP